MDQNLNGNGIEFSIEQIGTHFGNATIEIPRDYINKLHMEASYAQQRQTNTHGFSRGTTPLAYIEKNFQPHLLEHIKEFIFRYFVINWLYKELAERKIFLSGEPRLTDVSKKPRKNAHYNFSLSLSKPILLQGWKRLPFKAPKRKNYKDLDRQVENFLKHEFEHSKNNTKKVIQVGDWVNFTVELLNKNNEPLFNNYSENLWIKIGMEEIDSPFQTLFLGREKNTAFISYANCLQKYFSSHIDTRYGFKIVIVDFVPYTFFDPEQFKKHFRIRNNKELHQKLIEVFSFRDDLSQRRATTEDTLKLLLSRHIFDVPNHLILRKEKELLDAMQKTSDYHVYKMQPDFRKKIRMLATKQVKEFIFTHQLSIHENINIKNNDIKNYLNLTKRPRMREFLYFKLPNTKWHGQEYPISSSILTQYCLREKTLNHAIHYLTKNNMS